VVRQKRASTDITLKNGTFQHQEEENRPQRER
jgi:hypothetical protein